MKTGRLGGCPSGQRNWGNTSLLTWGAQALASGTENKPMLNSWLVVPCYGSPEQAWGTPSVTLPEEEPFKDNMLNALAKQLKPGRRNQGQDPEEGSHRPEPEESTCLQSPPGRLSRGVAPQWSFPAADSSVPRSQETVISARGHFQARPLGPHEPWVQCWSTEPARHAALQRSHRSPQLTRPEAASTSSPSGGFPRRAGDRKA